MDLETIEAALKAGNLWAQMSNGRYWRVRRNGKTQTWKTRPGNFRVPIKAGLRSYGEVSHDSEVAFENAPFVISETDPN